MSEFYLYRHIRPDVDIPFYIGIGCNKECAPEYSRAFSVSQRSKHWLRVFNKCNKQITVDILFTTSSLTEIQNKEKEFIALYGRKDLHNGPLVNFTDGGEGVWGLKMSMESRQKMSLKKKGRPSPKKGCSISQIQKDRLREVNLGKTMSEVTKTKIATSSKGRKHSEESKKKIGMAHIGGKSRLGMAHNEETKKKIGLKSKGRKHTTEAKAKMSQSRIGNTNWLGKKHSSVTRNKIGDASSKRRHSEETKEKMRLSHIGKVYKSRGVKRKPLSESTKNKIRLKKIERDNLKRLQHGHT